MQTLYAGYSKVGPKIFAPPQTPFPSYHGNRATNKQTGPISIHCIAKLSTHCNNDNATAGTVI